MSTLCLLQGLLCGSKDTLPRAELKWKSRPMTYSSIEVRSTRWNLEPHAAQHRTELQSISNSYSLIRARARETKAKPCPDVGASRSGAMLEVRPSTAKVTSNRHIDLGVDLLAVECAVEIFDHVLRHAWLRVLDVDLCVWVQRLLVRFRHPHPHVHVLVSSKLKRVHTVSPM